MDEATSRSYRDLAKSLHDKTVEFTGHLANLTSVNNGLKTKCEEALTALQSLGSGSGLCTRITCNICYTRERTHALIPCGHGGICQLCANRVVRRGRCHNCRTAVESNVRVFM